MTIGTIDEAQRKAATVVGFSYLLRYRRRSSPSIAFDNAA
jgi:hypothetical protein